MKYKYTCDMNMCFDEFVIKYEKFIDEKLKKHSITSTIIYNDVVDNIIYYKKMIELKIPEKLISVLNSDKITVDYSYQLDRINKKIIVIIKNTSLYEKLMFNENIIIIGNSDNNINFTLEVKCKSNFIVGVNTILECVIMKHYNDYYDSGHFIEKINSLQ